MPENYDEYDRRDDFDDRGGETASSRTAMKRLSFPGLLLVLFGMIGIVIETGFLAAAFSQPSIMYVQLKNLAQGMPPGPDRDANLKMIEDAKASLQLNTPGNLASCAIGWLLNLFMILGGISMRRLGSYGLSLTGAICGLIPLGGCCCLSMPIGLWVVIVLANADVRRVFARPNRG